MLSGLFYISGLQHQKTLAKEPHEALQNLQFIFSKCHNTNKHTIHHIAHAQKEVY